MNKKRIIIKSVAMFLTIVLFITATSVPVKADNLFEELFGISFFNFHWVDENGRQIEESFYNWGSSGEDEHGIKIERIGMTRIKVVIDADSNDTYQQCKPVLLWMHKGDSLFDATKWTDPELWYKNKLETTFLLCEIPDYTQDCEIIIDVPINIDYLSIEGLIDGGYYELEFYSEDAIPEQLMYAYEAQTYTLEELEQYMQFDAGESVNAYYNADSGFRSTKDGMPFRNTDFELTGGFCAGISALTTSKYNGFDIVDSFKWEETTYYANETYTWYDAIYTDSSIHDIVLNDIHMLYKNSPSKNMNDDGTADAFMLALLTRGDENDDAFYGLLSYYHGKNNLAVALGGNMYIGSVPMENLENRWSIIDEVVSELRQGNTVIVNLSAAGQGGHAIVGYKMERIDENTYRLYCYDSNWPDDMRLHYIGDEKNSDVDENGMYENIAWAPTQTYIDFTRKTVTGNVGIATRREFEVFEFDSTHTSFATSSSQNGTIAFSKPNGNGVNVINYGGNGNEIVAYKAFPVIESDTTVQIRVFAFYKSGAVSEVTSSINTVVKMDYDFIGWYKIKDSKITLTKSSYKFGESANQYVECCVIYNNHTDSFGQIQVRIPIVNNPPLK